MHAAFGADRGLALIVTLMAILMLMALSLVLSLNAMMETAIAAGFRSSQEALYAAEAGIECAVDELPTVADWTGVLEGVWRSARVDGPPSGARTLADGSTIDLTVATNMLNCGRVSTCTIAQMNNSTVARPWGTNNPRWALYAYGPLGVFLSTGAIDSNMYLAVWVADDPSENDDDPTTDGDAESNPGSGVLVLHAEAFGPRGTHKVIEAFVSRAHPTQIGQPLRMLAWREIRI